MHLLIKDGMGWIEVITGSMFSGKSEELIRRMRRAKHANQELVVFKHSSDNRYDDIKVSSHNQDSIEAVPVSTVEEMRVLIKEKYKNVRVVAIDEAQFFGEEIAEFCDKLADDGKRVVVAGLDQDFRGEPFKPMDRLMSIAEYVDKFNAICASCGNPASRTQRLVNQEPAYEDDPIVLVGASESYEPRCRKCHVVKKRNKE